MINSARNMAIYNDGGSSYTPPSGPSQHSSSSHSSTPKANDYRKDILDFLLNGFRGNLGPYLYKFLLDGSTSNVAGKGLEITLDQYKSVLDLFKKVGESFSGTKEDALRFFGDQLSKIIPEEVTSIFTKDDDSKTNKNPASVSASPGNTASAGSATGSDSDLDNFLDRLMQIHQNEMDYNSAQAEANRQFQMEMSNTAHQREVADLKAAGLNPVLSAGGTGASTPTGDSGSSNDSGILNVMSEMFLYAMEQMKQTAVGVSKSEDSLKDTLAMNALSGISSLFGSIGNTFARRAMYNATKKMWMKF